MKPTRHDLNYLADLLPKLSYSALSTGELAIACQLIQALSLLIAKSGGMRSYPDSMRNIRGYMHGTRDYITALSSQMADSTSQQAAATPSAPRYGVVQAAARPEK